MFNKLRGFESIPFHYEQKQALQHNHDNRGVILAGSERMQVEAELHDIFKFSILNSLHSNRH